MTELAIGQILTQSGGTAFAVAPRLGVTAYHCVGDRGGRVVKRRAFTIKFSDGSFVEATVRGEGYPQLDAVLLDLSPALAPAFRCLALAPLTAALRERRVRIRGFPLDRDFEYAAVVAADVVETDVPIYDGMRSLQLLSDAVGFGQNLTGFSGAPVLVGDDICVGMVVFGRPSDEPGVDVRTGTFFAARTADLVAVWPVLKQHVVVAEAAVARASTPLECARLTGTRWPIRIDALWSIGRRPSVLVLGEPEGADVLRDLAHFAEQARDAASGSSLEVPVWTDSAHPELSGRVVEATHDDVGDVLSALEARATRVIAGVRGRSHAAVEEECRLLRSVLVRNGVPVLSGTRFLARPPGDGDHRLLATAARERTASGVVVALARDGLRYCSRTGPLDADAGRRVTDLAERVDRIESVGDVVGSLAATDVLLAPPVIAWAGARGGPDAAAVLGACADDPILVSWWLAGASAAEHAMPDPLTLSRLDAARLRTIVWAALAIERRWRPLLSHTAAGLWALASSIPTHALKEAWGADARVAPGAAVRERRPRPPAAYATAVRDAVWSYACDGDYTPVVAAIESSQRHERTALGLEPETDASLPIVSDYARALRAALEPVALVG